MISYWSKNVDSFDGFLKILSILPLFRHENKSFLLQTASVQLSSKIIVFYSFQFIINRFTAYAMSFLVGRDRFASRGLKNSPSDYFLPMFHRSACSNP